MHLIYQSASFLLSTSSNSPPYVTAISAPTSNILAVLSSTSTPSSSTLTILDTISTTSHSLSSINLPSAHNATSLARGGTSLILTGGLDGSVRAWDVRTGTEVWAVWARGGDTDGNDNGGKIAKSRQGPTVPILSVAMERQGMMLAAGTELIQAQAMTQVWDVRSLTKPFRRYVESHNDDVTVLAFHPNDSQCLLSGSTDGLVNLYNTSQSSEDDALLQVYNHGASIHRAGFLSPCTIYALSHDESFAIYGMDSALNIDDDHDNGNNCQKDGGEVSNSTWRFGDLRPRLKCDYVVDVAVVGTDGEDEQAKLITGRHSEGTIDVVPLRRTKGDWKSDTRRGVRRLKGHGDAMVRCAHADRVASMVYTGGEDGQVKTWSIGKESDSDTEMEEAIRGRGDEGFEEAEKKGEEEDDDEKTEVRGVDNVEPSRPAKHGKLKERAMKDVRFKPY